MTMTDTPNIATLVTMEGSLVKVNDWHRIVPIVSCKYGNSNRIEFNILSRYYREYAEIGGRIDSDMIIRDVGEAERVLQKIIEVENDLDSLEITKVFAIDIEWNRTAHISAERTPQDFESLEQFLRPDWDVLEDNLIKNIGAQIDQEHWNLLMNWSSICHIIEGLSKPVEDDIEAQPRKPWWRRMFG